MKVLFAARNYPPNVGGAEKLNYDLARYLSKFVELDVIPNRFGKYSPIFHFYVFLRVLFKKVDVIFLSDTLLAPLIPLLKILKRKPVIIKVHGLDITYPNRLYQLFIPMFTNMADKIICISEATKYECIKRGIDPDKCTVIPVGIEPNEIYLNKDKQELRNIVAKKLKLDLHNKKILLSVGRLVERKGFHWFVENVIPKLIEREENLIYLIAGDGPYREIIEEIITNHHLEDYVKLLGKVDDETLRLLYNVVDIFVMPNIPVEGDMEGFGIVILEAASCGVPVVASNLEGIRDAIVEEKNGFLVKVYDVDEFIKIINRLLRDNKKERNLSRIRNFTLNYFNWDIIAKNYISEIYKIHKE